MADYGGGGGGGGCWWCCRCCFSFILTSGFTAFFLWLSLRASKPKCYIKGFYMPALNKSANTPTNHTISFDLELDNPNKDKGIYYDDVNLNFFYGRSQNDTVPGPAVSNYTAPRFYQGHGKNAHRRALVETHGVPWEAASQEVSNGTAVFRVGLDTAVRFKIVFWSTKRYRLRLKADVEVNDSGQKVKHKGVRLKSGAPSLLGCYRALMLMGPLLIAAFFTL